MTKMKNILKISLILQILLVILVCSACSKESVENYAFTPIGNQNADYEFTFESNLPEEKPVYPLSTGRIFYVSTQGSDSNDGLSVDSPIQSLDKVNDLDLIPGDSVLFRKGDTFEGVIRFTNLRGDNENPITFASYGDGNQKPIIEANETVMLFEKCDNIVVRDLQVNVNGIDRMAPNTVCISGIQFSYSFVGNGKYRNVYICDNYVLGNGVSNNIMGIVVDGTERTIASTPSNVLTTCYITGNEVAHVGRSGIHSGGWLTNESVNQNQALLDYYRDFHFDNNYVHHIGCMGVYIVACTNSTINRNLIHDTGIYDVNQLMEGECGIMALGTENCQIMFNECYNIFDQNTGYDAMGIDIDWNTNNVLVQYNYLHDCQGSGIGTMANQNSFILNNKIERAQGATNHTASIQVTNYTSKYEAVDEGWHSVKNLMIANNLIIHEQPDKNVFSVKTSNGDIEFEGNSFINNHSIYTGNNLGDFKWVYIDPLLPWYKFSGNKWYSNDTSKFSCFDMTQDVDIDIEHGAKPYEKAAKKNFADWAARDVGATYQKINNDIPANINHLNLKYENGWLYFDWNINDGDVWHFNIYEVGENEEVMYTNMIGEAFETNFSYKPTTKGVRYYVIQPESNQGVLGKAIKIKVTL